MHGLVSVPFHSDMTLDGDGENDAFKRLQKWQSGYIWKLKSKCNLINALEIFPFDEYHSLGIQYHIFH